MAEAPAPAPVGPQGDPEATESEDVIYERVLGGEFNNIPPTARKLVRIFTSSTFTDTLVERNMLMEEIYPRLKDFCRDHMLEFQVVDMRWGVRDESTDEHKTADLCMTELSGCQKYSLGPNFVTFLAQKYGYRPLPVRIVDTEFLMLMSVLEEEPAALLKSWYIIDTNAIPNVYTLQNITSVYKHFLNKADKELMGRDQGAWWKLMAEMCTIIRTAAKRLLDAGRFTVENNHWYNWSVTEQEVVNGIIRSKNNVDHTFAFIREIRNINIKLFQHSAKYIDINMAEKKVDQEAVDLLNLLKNVKVPQKLDAGSIIPVSLEWSDNNGINAVDHAEYLKEFGETFYVRLVELIERALNRRMKLCQNKMFCEVLQHAHFTKNNTRLFKGREELIGQCMAYVADEERNQPFVFFGVSGCGKSSIMAKVATTLKATQPPNALIVIRFLGTTVDSSAIYPLLKNLCTQISHVYQKPLDAIPFELSNLTNYFKKLLECATQDKPLFILLDSLDQLNAANSAHALSWMPVYLPKHCKFIISTLEGLYGIVDTCHKMIETEENFAKVDLLGETLAVTVLFELLGSVSRTIESKYQLPLIKECFKACNSPLYVRLVFDQIYGINVWKSYTTNQIVPRSIDECIKALFNRVENAHGKILVSHALAYVTAAKNGLSDSEVEDLISIDETVLNDIYQYHLPPIRRIPPLLWTRIKADVPAYLSEREADGISVVFWFHRQFVQVSTDRYLYDPNFKIHIHSQISDYFIGVWAGKPKPFEYSSDQMKMFRLKTPFGQADRKVPDMPEMFINPVDNTERCNSRKLSELPFHLIRSKRIQDLYDKCLFHYDFMFAKLSCQPLNNLISDYEDLLSYKIDKEVILVSDALRLASSQLSISPTNLVPQLIGRLLPYYFIKNSRKIRNVKSLLDKCESDGLKNSALIPAFNCFHVPGGPLVFSLEGHPFAVYGVYLMINETQLLSVSNRFIIFDLSSGDVMRIINPGIEGIMQCLSVSQDSKYCVSYSNNDQIVVCNIISGDTKIYNRYSAPPPPAPPPPPLPKGAKPPPKPKEKPKVEEPKDQPKEYSDTFVGAFANNVYFVVWSKYFYYVYDKKGRLVKYEKMVLPLIQVEIIENPSIKDYGIELEIFMRAEDCRDDQEFERENLILDYKFVLDPLKMPKKKSNVPPPSGESIIEEEEKIVTDEDINEMYIPSCSRIEIHSCAVLSRNKKTLFTCTEIGDNVVECFRNRVEKKRHCKVVRNLWRYHGALDDNTDALTGLVLSSDERYMLASTSWGFKVFYLLTGQSKPLKLPQGIKNIPIGYKKLTFPAVFTRENKFVVTGVKDNVYIWETSYGVYIKALDAHYGRISTLVAAFGGENKNLVLSASMDKTIKIWNINNILEEDFILDHFEKPIEMLHVSINADIAMVMTRNQLAIVSLKDGRIKYNLCNSPHGAIFICSALSVNGNIAVSSESNRLVIWDMEEKKTTFVASTASNQVHIKQLKFHQAEVYVLCAYLDINTKNVTITNFMVPDGDIIFNIEYSLKQGTEYKEFVVTADDAYIVIYRNDKKADMLSIHTATDGECAHTIKLSYPNYIPELFTMIIMREKPHYIVLVDAEKGNIINVKDKKFVRSIPKWNGKATKDDKFGLYAPTRGGLELIELKNGTKVKTFIPKVAEGVFDVDTLITENDRHIIYYHSGKRTIRVFNVETCRCIANYKSAARVRCMVAAQDSRSIIFGCEDGTVNMLIIADPMYEDYVEYLREWRAEQLNLFGREVVDEDTPPPEPADNALQDPVPNAINFEPQPDEASLPAPGGEPMLEGSEPMPEGGEPMPEGGEPMPEGGEPMPEGGEPMLESSEPIPDGSEPLTEVSEPISKEQVIVEEQQDQTENENNKLEETFITKKTEEALENDANGVKSEE